VEKVFQKVDAFSVIFDTSQSMDDTYKNDTKMNQQKRLVALFEKTIPNLKLTGSLRMFGQFVSVESSKAVFLDRDYKKPRLMQAIAPITTGYGFSPLDAALDGATADLCSQPGRLAVIAFSDGEDMEKHDPVAAAKRMKAAFGDRICIYTVHLGDNAGGKKLMQQVADSGQCGFMVTGDSISTPAGMASFVEKVFLEKKGTEFGKEQVSSLPTADMKKQADAEKEAAAEIERKILEKGRATLRVAFDFDKAVVKPKYIKEIEKVADIMKKYPELNIVVEGHTCNIGPAKYNNKLSQRRAEAVKKVMVNKFKIDSTRIKTKGYGLT
jgi:OmpA-OmpF porin, OOP family